MSVRQDRMYNGEVREAGFSCDPHADTLVAGSGAVLVGLHQLWQRALGIRPSQK